MTIAEAPFLDEELSPRLPDLHNQFSAQDLEPIETYNYSTTVSLYDQNDVREVLGISANIPLEIEAGSNRFLVVDLRGNPKDSDGHRVVDGFGIITTDFVLIEPQKWMSSNHESGFKGLNPSKPIIIGREGNEVAVDRMALTKDKNLSRKHFEITIRDDNSINLKDLASMNGTSAISAEHSSYSSRTSNAVDRLSEKIEFKKPTPEAPYGYLQDHQIIGRHSTKLDGGVYVGGSAREAIVVDSKTDPVLEDVYQDTLKLFGAKKVAEKVLSKIRPKTKSNDNIEDSLRSVLNVVQSYMSYDGPAVEEFSNHFVGDKFVKIGEYIDKRIGVCRHQALLAGYLIERLIEEGHLKGVVSVERNTIPEYGGSHAWATFKTADNQQIVIDPAQSFVGTKKAARQNKRWDYYLPLE